MRIVATAFTCEPNLGSEYEVGWKWSQALADFSDSLILVRRKSYDNLIGELVSNKYYGEVKLINGVMYKALDFPLLNDFLGERIFMRTHYFFWMFLCLVWIRLNRSNFDFNHHICFVAPWNPPLTYFAGLPFIWGPIGTGAPLPAWSATSFKERLWNFVTQILPQYNPILAHIVNNSQAVIPINSHVQALIKGDKYRNSYVIPAIAVDEEIISKSCEFCPIDRATIIFSGRNAPFKMPLLSAKVGEILLNKYPNLNFIMIGEGLEKLSHMIDHRIALKKPVDRLSFQKLLTKANLLLFPTTEGSGFVALEALSVGLPIVCLEASGPHDFIEGIAGISCPIKDSMEETALSLAAACESLLTNQKLWDHSSNMAGECAKNYTWSILSRRLRDIYSRSKSVKLAS